MMKSASFRLIGAKEEMQHRKDYREATGQRNPRPSNQFFPSAKTISTTAQSYFVCGASSAMAAAEDDVSTMETPGDASPLEAPKEKGGEVSALETQMMQVELAEEKLDAVTE